MVAGGLLLRRREPGAEELLVGVRAVRLAARHDHLERTRVASCKTFPLARTLCAAHFKAT